MVNTVYSGMTLRDWFAGQALAGIRVACQGPEGHVHHASSQDAAQLAHQDADAMLAERAKGQS